MGERPATVHDFGGFPEALYALQYPAKGSPTIAQAVSDCLITANFETTFAPQQGWDHGAWVPLMKLYPKAQIPVVQISLPALQTPAFYYALGQALAPLRAQGLMVIASGSLTHNLYDVRLHSDRVGSDAAPVAPITSVAPYVLPFRNWVQARVEARDLPALLNYRVLAPFAVECHPTDEHWLPLYVALGAGEFENFGAKLNYFSGELAHYTLAMDNVVLT